MRRVKFLGKNSDVPEFEHQPSANSYLEALRAETILAKMDWFEEIATEHDAETSPGLRRKFAVAYAKVIGIHPDRRHTLRRALAQVREGSDAKVTELIGSLNED